MPNEINGVETNNQLANEYEILINKVEPNEQEKERVIYILEIASKDHKLSELLNTIDQKPNPELDMTSDFIKDQMALLREYLPVTNTAKLVQNTNEYTINNVDENISENDKACTNGKIGQ